MWSIVGSYLCISMSSPSLGEILPRELMDKRDRKVPPRAPRLLLLSAAIGVTWLCRFAKKPAFCLKGSSTPYEE